MLTGTVIRSLRSSPRASEKPSSAAAAASAGGGGPAGSAGGGAAPIADAATSGRNNVFIGRPPIGRAYSFRPRESKAARRRGSDEGEGALAQPRHGGRVDARRRHQDPERGAGGAVEGVRLAERAGYRRARFRRDQGGRRDVPFKAPSERRGEIRLPRGNQGDA